MVHNNDMIAAAVPWLGLSIATFIPAWRISVRVGISRWWSFISFIPVFGTLIILWIIAYRTWPKWSLNAPRS
jgi:hypothetical protein